MPCKIQGPVVSEIAEEIGDEAKICKLDIQNNQRVAAELGIRNIPTILVFKNGKIVKKFVGIKTKPVLMKALKETLKD
jgi:thioredoxin 1